MNLEVVSEWPKSPFIPFGTSVCLENQLERLSKQCKKVQKWSRSNTQNQGNFNLHFVYSIKILDKSFSSLVCDKNSSNGATFFDEI